MVLWLWDIAIQLLSFVWLFVTPWTAAHQASLSFTTFWVCSISCPLNHWCHPTISPSVVPFSWLQSFPASGSFPMSQLFASGGQSIGASASVLPMNIQGWFPWILTGLISLQSKWLSRLFQHHSLKASVLQCSVFMVQLSHLYLTTGKTIIWLYGPLSAKWCLCVLIFCLGFSEFFFQGASVF